MDLKRCDFPAILHNPAPKQTHILPDSVVGHFLFYLRPGRRGAEIRHLGGPETVLVPEVEGLHVVHSIPPRPRGQHPRNEKKNVTNYIPRYLAGFFVGGGPGRPKKNRGSGPDPPIPPGGSELKKKPGSNTTILISAARGCYLPPTPPVSLAPPNRGRGVSPIGVVARGEHTGATKVIEGERRPAPAPAWEKNDAGEEKSRGKKGSLIQRQGSVSAKIFKK